MRISLGKSSFSDRIFSSATFFSPNITWFLWAGILNSPCSQQVLKVIRKVFRNGFTYSIILCQVTFQWGRYLFYCPSFVCLLSPEKPFMVFKLCSCQTTNWRLTQSTCALLCSLVPLQALLPDAGATVSPFSLELLHPAVPKALPSASEVFASLLPGGLEASMQASLLGNLFWHHRSRWGFHLYFHALLSK